MAKETIHNCPNCGSKETNKVSWSNYFCKTCFVEFSGSKVFKIQYDGELVPFYVNEFENCG